MQKLIRLLIIYTAITTTLVLGSIFYIIRNTTEQNKKVQANIDTLRYNLGKITDYQESSKEIAQKLDSLSLKIINDTDKEVLGKSNQSSDSSKITSGFVTINDKKWQTVDVYESNSYSSKIVGKIEFNQAYQYSKKDGSWYQIILPKSQISGWVAGRFLEEITDNGPK